MNYVFDNGPLSSLFRNFYRNTFRSLWERFDELVANGRLTSVREVLREIEDGGPPNLAEWVADHPDLFPAPTATEGAFVARIYNVKHFQQNIEQKKILRGGRVADPFVIAKAATETRTVVTTEFFKPNAVKIPNICRHFEVPCLTLQQFMEEEGWQF
jgi:hypothetical protein